jgi:hypothetical protein
VAGLNDPPSGAPVGVAFLEFDLLPAGADMWREAVVGEQLADLLVVVGLVQAGALGIGLGRLGPVDRDRVERFLQQLVVVAVRAVVRDPDRDAGGLGKD